MSRREWGPVVAAVVTVLVCVALQVGRSAPSGAVGEASYAKEVERLMAEERWAEAVRVCRKALRKHLLERRAHFYLSRCLIETGLPDLSLEHLVLSAVPSSVGTEPVLLAGPSEDEIDGQIARLDERYADVMARDWSRWRKARLAALAGRSDAAKEELGSLGRGNARAADELDKVLLSAGLGVSLDEADGALPAVGTGGILERLGLAHRFSGEELGALGASLPGHVIVTVGGEFAGNCCVVRVGDRVHRYEAEKTWLLLTIVPLDGSVVREQRDPLAPITKERAVIEGWLDGLRPGALVVGCASAEAVNGMSEEARTALNTLCGLREVPMPDALLAYAFVGYWDGNGMHVVEAVAAAPDVPAMVVIE